MYRAEKAKLLTAKLAKNIREEREEWPRDSKYKRRFV
jgi:hypothetical protein